LAHQYIFANFEVLQRRCWKFKPFVMLCLVHW